MPSMTHWAGCYRERGHHDCAVAEVERLRGLIMAEAEYCYGYMRKYTEAGDAARAARHQQRGDRLRAALEGK